MTDLSALARRVEEAKDEREIACETCGGDGEFQVVVGRGGWDGPLTEYRKCRACDGTGRVTVIVEPITLEDLSDES